MFSLNSAKHVLVGFGMAFLAGCGGSGSDTANAAPNGASERPVKGDLVSVAQNAGSFSTLIKAIQEAGLEETVRTAPELTVFAPTDDAFKALPEGVLEGLLANKEALKNVLLYHVVSGKFPASTAVKSTSAPVLNGQSVSLKLFDGTLFVDESRVIATDIMATNGIIHVIDKVLLPPSGTTLDEKSMVSQDLISTAEAAGSFKTLLAAVRAAGLEETLRNAKDVTLFAPTDEAFAKIPETDLKALLADREALTNILLYHIIRERIPAKVAVTLNNATMLNGSTISLKVCEGVLKINDSIVIAADIEGGNGVIHVIDTVLIP